MKTFVTFLGIFIVLVTSADASVRNVTLGGLIPLTGTTSVDQGHQSLVVLPVLRMALEEINQRSDILAGYELKLYFNDTKCSPGYGSRVLFDMIDSQPNKVAVLGPGCSSVSERLVDVSSTWNIIMVTYIKSTFSATQNAKRNFFTTMTSDGSLNDACVALMMKFQWRRVALIRQQGIVYSRAFNDLQEKLKKSGIQVITSETFSDKSAEHLEEIKAKQARIIVGKFNQKHARQVFCQAYKLRQYGQQYAWILLDGYDDDWWKKEDKDVPCTQQELQKGFEGVIILTNLGIRLDRHTSTISGMTSQEFIQKYEAESKQSANEGQAGQAGFAYDAAWALALALNQSETVLSKRNESLGNFTYEKSKIANTIKDSLLGIHFEGVTGLINFTSNGERIGYIGINQIQGGERKLASVYTAHNQTLLTMNPGFSWSNKNPPLDHPQVRIIFMAISPALYGVMATISVICIMVAVGFLVFNIKFSHCKYLKMSSPRLNDAILVGCIFMYLSVFLLGLDGSAVPSAHVGGICQVRVWFACLGFTIAFGAMFAKTWRVYVIFTNAKLRKKVIHDEKLFLMVGALLFVDIIVLGLWSGLDPLQRKIENGTLKHGSDMDELQQWEQCECTYFNIWRGIIYSSKGLLLVFGLFLAWETRHVNIPALNDSHYICMSVYNVVLLTAIGVPLTFVIRNNQNASFALAAVVVLYCTTVTMCLVFIPKLIAVKRDPEILNSLGGTSVGTSQGGAESSASQDKYIGGPKYIALTAENANLKKHIQEKEEQITALESRLCKAGVPAERVKKIAQAFKTSTATHLSPSMSALGEARESIHIELNKNKAKEAETRTEGKGMVEEKRDGDASKGVYDDTRSFDGVEKIAEERKTEDLPSPRQRYPSTSNIETRTCHKEDLSKKNSLPNHKYTTSGNAPRNDVKSYVIESYENPAVKNDIIGDVIRKEARSETDPESITCGMPAEIRPAPSPRLMYKAADVVGGSEQTGKDDRGKVVLASKMGKGETFFQLRMARAGSVGEANVAKGAVGLVEYNFQDIQDV
ncbi:gamma-aminobutyric acid type B receptor subunit 2-like isoform X2 [Actinia tenebrosa]|uniref:Gamma-aminobutyric acid type B receptor subunit 2-like isoform X2 n=1 Tax=Actinia tenebrosa TaxID=6105 RepID=A0A6P8IJ25_ACTTE|nr:gamma-aminobutyric acid type B receptor subunit 2-like isoform X2 [Actinia tenebrosa]